MSWKLSSDAPLCSHYSPLFSYFSKYLIVHTTLRISDLLISSLEKLCKSSYRHGANFFCDHSSVTRFKLHYSRDTPYISFNTGISFHTAIMLLADLLIQRTRSAWLHRFIDAITQSLPHNLWIILLPILCFQHFK